MTLDEAETKAKELYGPAAHVRILLGREIDVGRVGFIVSCGFNIKLYGFGATWEEAFDNLEKKNVGHPI